MSERRFGVVRSILQRPPSEEVWELLLRALELWTPDERDFSGVVLPYVRDYLSRWPEAVERVAPYQWAGPELHGELVLTSWALGLSNTIRPQFVQPVASMDFLAGLMGAAGFESISEVSLVSLSLGEAEATLLSGAQAAHVRRWGWEKVLLTAEGLELLERRGFFATTQRLRVRPVETLEPALLARLLACCASSPGLELELRDKGWSDAHFEVLSTSPGLARLTRLELDRTHISRQSLEALRGAAGLKALRFRDCELERAEALAALAQVAPALERLALEGSEGEGVLSGLEALACAGYGVRALYVGNLFVRGLAQALSASPGLSALASLTCFNCQLYDDDVAVLCDAGVLSGLSELSLSYNPVGSRGARALAEAEGMSGLISLELSYTHVGDDGAQALAQSVQLGDLEALSLASAQVGAAGAQALAESACLGRLTRLDLSRCPIQVGALAFVCGAVAQRLERLGLFYSGVSEQAMSALCAPSSALRANAKCRLARAYGGSPALALALSLEAPWLDFAYSSERVEHKLEGADVIALAQDARLGLVLQINLEGQPVGAPEVEALLASPYIEQIKRWQLSWEALGVRAYEQLVASGRLGAELVSWLESRLAQAAPLVALVRRLEAEQVEQPLVLARYSTSMPQVLELLSHPAMLKVRSVTLGSSLLARLPVIEALCGLASRGALTELVLDDCSLGRSEAALVQTLLAGAFKRLSMSSNGLSDDFVAQVRALPRARCLESVALSYNAFNDVDRERLLRSEVFAGVDLVLEPQLESFFG